MFPGYQPLCSPKLLAVSETNFVLVAEHLTKDLEAIRKTKKKKKKSPLKVAKEAGHVQRPWGIRTRKPTGLGTKPGRQQGNITQEEMA